MLTFMCTCVGDAVGYVNVHVNWVGHVNVHVHLRGMLMLWVIYVNVHVNWGGVG